MLLERFEALWRNLLRRSQVERDLDDELGAYVAGLSADPSPDAQRLAQLERRSIESVKDEVRDVRAGERLEILRRDLRFGARTLAKTPGFTIAAVLALALGIGANTAMLSVVNGVLLRPLPYADPDRLVVILHDGRNPVSPGNFTDWRTQTKSFSGFAAAEYWTPNLIGVDQPEHVTGLRVSAGLLPMLGVPPLLGRFFTEAEDRPGGDNLAVISYGLWQRRLGGDRGVLGRQVLLDGVKTTIIGVMPETFQFAPFWATRAELWAPAAFGAKPERNANSLRVFARLAPGVSLAQARRDLDAVTARLEQQFPGTNRQVTIQPLKDKVVGAVQTPLLVLLGAVAFVLLIACANVAHMLLARATSRQKELGIRTALGATRRRLVAQLLSESLLLALAGGTCGLLLAAWGVRTFAAAGASSIPRVATVGIDRTVLAMTVAITFVTAGLFGLLPAIRATRVDLVDAFKDGDRGSSEGRQRTRLRSALVASEFALALVLLAGAGLMIRTFVALQRIDPGFDASNVITMDVSVTGTAKADSTHREATFVEILDRIRAIPGVESASWINHLPIAGDQWGLAFHVDGRPEPKPGEAPTAVFRVVFPDYFRTMRIPLRRGRDIAVADRADSPRVVVINEFMAKTYWPGEDPIGKRLSISGFVGYTVIGIVKNAVRDQWAAPPHEELFVAYAQATAYRTAPSSRFGYLTLVARATCATGRRCDAAAAALATPVVSVIRSIDRSLPISDVQTMRSVVDGATAEPRLYLVLLASFAGIAIVLASVGIYGVMSYTVARRTHEIGIRIALGAEPASVVRMIVRQGMMVALSGAGAGLAAALLLTRLMGGLLYGVAPRDPVTFAAVVVVLAGVAIVANYVPAHRATRIDPLLALRAE